MAEEESILATDTQTRNNTVKSNLWRRRAGMRYVSLVDEREASIPKTGCPINQEVTMGSSLLAKKRRAQKTTNIGGFSEAAYVFQWLCECRATFLVTRLATFPAFHAAGPAEPSVICRHADFIHQETEMLVLELLAA